MVWYIRLLKPPTIDQKGHVRALVTVTTDLGDGFYPTDLILYALITNEQTWVSEWQTIKWKSGMRTGWVNIDNVDADPLMDLRLVVNSTQSCEGNSISLENMPEIFGVWSDTFNRNKSQAGSMIQRRYRTDLNHEKTIMEETGESIARHIWDAGISLVAFLNTCVLQSRPISDLAKLFQKPCPRGLRILELGSGCGITGLHVVGLCSKSSTLLTDLPDAMDLLNRNVEIAKSASSRGELATAVLDWGEPLPRMIVKQQFNLVVLSDCTYNPDSIPGLVKTLSSLARVSPNALIVVSLKKRHDSEAIFFDLMAGANFIEVEHSAISLPDRCRTETGQDLEMVEVYVYRIQRSVADV